MKAILFLPLLLLAAPVSAAKLANCDSVPHDVIIRNDSHIRTETLSPWGGSIQEWGPRVSFQIAGDPPFRVDAPDAEYCIWSGHISVQRVHTLRDSGH